MSLSSSGAMLTRGPEAQHPLALREGHLSSAFWIPREVPCRCCQEMAMMEATERVRDEEIVVRYDCPDCGWRQVRRFIESDLDTPDIV